MLYSKYKKYIPWILLLFTFIFTVLLNYYVQWRCLDSDMAGEMILANLLNKEGTLISKNWYYSTEVRVFCEQIWFKLGLLFFPNNWRLARLTGHSINLAILIISLLFLLYSTSIKEKGIWIAIVLLLPFDFWYLFHVLYGGFYICHTVALFIMLGLLLRYIDKRKTIYLVLMVIFGIAFGLNGIKVLMYFTAPCILMTIILVIYGIINKNKTIPFIKTLIIGTIVASLSTFIGAGVYLLIISKAYTNASFHAAWSSINISNLIHTIINYLQSLGFVTSDVFQTDINIFSIEGLIGVFGAINALTFIISFISLFRKKYFNECKEKLLFIFIVCAYIIETGVFTLTSESANGSYWLPLIPFSLIIIEIFIESIKNSNIKIKCFRVLMVISFILCSFVNNDWYLKNKPRSSEGIHEVANWLQEQGCTKVIAKFWQGDVITEYSNGKIEVYTVEEFNNFSTCRSLQEIKHVVSNLEKDMYIVFSIYDENDDFNYLEEKADIIYEYSDLIVYKVK